jgi:hypothetical protein
VVYVAAVPVVSVRTVGAINVAVVTFEEVMVPLIVVAVPREEITAQVPALVPLV